nr:hypothetical protein CFP56_39363 [Quercus suber]
MEASSSTSSSLRRRAPFRCHCDENPVLVVSWTPDNLGKRLGESVNSSNGVMMRYLIVVRCSSQSKGNGLSD